MKKLKFKDGGWEKMMAHNSLSIRESIEAHAYDELFEPEQPKRNTGGLIPCPFCGSNKKNRISTGGYQIECSDCLYRSPIGLHLEDGEKRWNETKPIRNTGELVVAAPGEAMLKKSLKRCVAFIETLSFENGQKMIDLHNDYIVGIKVQLYAMGIDADEWLREQEADQCR